MKIAIITSISKLSQELHEPKNVFDDVDYHAFVDEISEKKTIWNQHKINHLTFDKKYEGRRLAKIYKVLPNLFLPNYDYYIWIDSTHEVIIHPRTIIEKMGEGSEIGLFHHSQRNCVYDEIEELVKLNYDNFQLLMGFSDFLKSENYPEKNGLFELSVIVRKNSHLVNSINIFWWEIICKFSSRDQISLPYVLNKMSITPYIFQNYASFEYSNSGVKGGNEIIPQIRKNKKTEMKNLETLNQTHKTDKGISHKYLPFYEKLFQTKRLEKLKILEIGVLFGASLKLWNDYFPNSVIYGIDDFSHKTGQDFYSFKPLVKEEIFEEFRNFDRIKILEADSQNSQEINKIFGNYLFDIIIDDGNHSLGSQMKTFENFNHLLSDNGIYVCEDVQSRENAELLKIAFNNKRKDRHNDIIEFDITNRFDDRIVYSI